MTISIRAHIEKAIGLIRQGQHRMAISVLQQALFQLPLDEEPIDIASFFDESDEITLELSVPMSFPSVEFETDEEGQHFLVIDAIDAWIIGDEEAQELQDLCYPLKELRHLSQSDLNTYKMSVIAKLKEMVLSRRITQQG